MALPSALRQFRFTKKGAACPSGMKPVVTKKMKAKGAKIKIQLCATTAAIAKLRKAGKIAK